MSTLVADTIKSRDNAALAISDNVNVTGVLTATSFAGYGSSLTGVASTDNIITGTAATFNSSVNFNYPINVNKGLNLTGVTTGLNVTGVGTITTATITSATVGSAVTVNSGGIDIASGVISATSYVGSGANLTGIESWNQQDTWLYS